MAFWDKTGDADGSSRGNYFPPQDGEFDIQIGAVKHKNGHEGEAVIVEMIVLASNNPEIQPGTQKSTAWNISKHKDMAINNIKSFVCGIYGLSEADKSPPTKEKINHVSKRMVEMDNPLSGIKVHLTTWKSITQKGHDFTNMKWAPYSAEPGYIAPMPGGAATLAVSLPTIIGVVPPGNPDMRGYQTGAVPPPPPPAERYFPEGTAPGRGATHRLVNNAWQPL
jgi:hypothetical protein